MLNEFRVQTITWDKANSKIYEIIKASQGDSNGRKLRVQILDNGEAINLSGTSLSLAWKSTTNKGLDNFELADANKGLFEIFYTAEMLSTSGKITASLVLIDSVGRLESDPFSISISRSIVDDDSVQSDNSFTALTEALVRVTDLEGNYAPRLNEVTAQLAQTNGQVNNLILEYDIDPNKDPEVISARGSYNTLGTRLTRLSDSVETPFNNLIKNGDFSQGKTSWKNNEFYNIDTTDYVFGFQSARLYHEFANTILYQTIQSQVGHVYYLALWAKTEVQSNSGDNTVGYTHDSVPTNYPINISRINSTEWVKRSGIVTATTNELSFGVSTMGANVGKTWVDGVTILDLTEMFGEGNEPTNDDISELEEEFSINYVDGSLDVGLIVNYLYRQFSKQGSVLDDFTTTENEGWII